MSVCVCERQAGDWLEASFSLAVLVRVEKTLMDAKAFQESRNGEDELGSGSNSGVARSMAAEDVLDCR